MVPDNACLILYLIGFSINNNAHQRHKVYYLLLCYKFQGLLRVSVFKQVLFHISLRKRLVMSVRIYGL